MMINKRLIGTVAESKKYIAGNVILQWCSLTANIALMLSISRMLAELFRGSASVQLFTVTGIVVILALAVRFFCSIGAAKMGYFSSKAVKKSLREKIYQKLLRLGSSYNEQVKTSEVVQVAVEGVDQLETYFGAYLPQFFYAMLAPLTLFIVLCFVNVAAAVVLLICVPLIPVAIAAVQTWAKKLLSKYWGQYTELGDTFLENLQGLTTLKIYQADAFKQQEMNEQAEKFRKITMKVLTMQLNSITIMDLIAYGGAALGVIMAVTQYQSGGVSLEGCLLIILLAADFFIPMRQLGSFFHIAMNGMAASDKIFRLLDLEETKPEITESFPSGHTIRCSGLSFSYEPDREILHSVDLTFPQGSFTALVGESGCGKSTLASILMGRNKGYTGSVSVGGVPLSSIQEESLLRNITYISHQSYLFKGIGALYLSDRLVQAFQPPYLGGEQERGLRPGTENLPYAMGLAAAAARLAKTMKSRDTAMRALNQRLRDGLAAFPEVVLNSPADAVPEVLNFSENCIKSETMLAFLAEAQIYVSSASACGRGQPSHTLAAMGRDPLAIDTAIRVSFCADNTPEDVDAFLNRFEDGMKHLQRIRK